VADESILVVDDNPASLKLVRIVLERKGYDVRTAADAEEALLQLSQLKPGLILMDVHLPRMDGLELTRRLKADAATRDIVVLALTASTTKGDEDSAAAAGCDGYVAKPIDVHSLPEVVAGYLAARGVTP
jgi:two-component system, cell cycle response regulator DivK